MNGDKFVQAEKSVYFERIKIPKFGEGLLSGEQYWEGSDKVQFRVEEKVYPAARTPERDEFQLRRCWWSKSTQAKSRAGLLFLLA